MMVVTFGLGIVSTDAATLGATALPEPNGDCEYPWLWWGEIFLQAPVANAGLISGFGTYAQRLEVDSKAMRKVTNKETLLWVAETSGVVGAPAVDITFGSTRILIGS